MKIVVIGGVAAGASAAARLRRLDSQAQIIVFERGEHAAFSNCSLPYYLGGVVADESNLVVMTPELFWMRYRIEVRTGSEVTAISRDDHCVQVREVTTGREYSEHYDKLIVAPGAAPIRPRSIPGIMNQNVFTMRNVRDAANFKTYLETVHARDVVVVGGGFIGIEAAENLTEAGYVVHLIEGLNQILAPFDEDMAQILHKELIDHGVRLYLGHMLSEICEHTVKASSEGKMIEIPADAVLLSIGVAPETRLITEAGLETGPTRGIRVNANYQTDDPDIYAVGDAVQSFNRLTGQPGILALAGPAQRQARAAADHIEGMCNRVRGFIGSSCLRVFGMNAACTGLNEKAAEKAGLNYDVAYVLPDDRVKIIPGAHFLAFKLVFEVPTGRVLGAQAVGQGDAVRRIDVIAAMISMNAVLEDLKDLELCYSPIYGTAKDVVNMAALVGLNLLHGRLKQVRVSEIRKLAEAGAYIVDVREKPDYEAGHICGAHNVPLSELHDRINEIPRDIPVYLHCRSGQRSYYAICELQGQGWNNVTNLSGSFLGLCLYEYFHDQTDGRKPIVTNYMFN